jgi:hypothetical protein
MSDRSNTCSGGVEDTLSQEVQLGSSIHLAFEEFEPGDLALRLPIAVRELQGRAHCSILLESRRKALQVWQPARQDRLKPGLQRVGRPLAHHLGKGLGQGSNLRNRRIVLLYLCHLRLLVWGPLLGAPHEEKRELPGSQARQECRFWCSGWVRRVRGPC